MQQQGQSHYIIVMIQLKIFEPVEEILDTPNIYIYIYIRQILKITVSSLVFIIFKMKLINYFNQMILQKDVTGRNLFIYFYINGYTIKHLYLFYIKKKLYYVYNV